MFQIYENINKIIKRKGLTRKEFAKKLMDLEPTVNRAGETPVLSSIYGYLNGRIIIPLNLIPFIAEVLNVTEQELFDTSDKTRKKCFKYFLQNASKEELEYFNNFINSQIHNNINVNYGKVIMHSKFTEEKIEEFSKLLKYAPVDFIDKVLNRLKEYEKISNKDLLYWYLLRLVLIILCYNKYSKRIKH